MLSFFKKASPSSRPTASVPLAKVPERKVSAAVVYPPTDPGFQAATVGDLLDSQHVLLERIRTAACTDEPAFERQYLSPIRAVGEYIHLLPASSFEHFSGPGGLFRFCVEKAFFCLQAAEGRIFTPLANVEERHALEPRWRYAAFLAGLLSEIYRPLASAIVTDRQGSQWPKFLGGLSSWLESGRRDVYFVTWQEGAKSTPTGAEGASVLGKVVPGEQLTWLDRGSPEITRDLFGVALGQASRQDSILADLTDSVREGILKRELLTRRSRYGHLRSGHHLEPYFLDSIRSRLESGQWKINDLDCGPVYFGTDGIYIEWPKSASEMKSDLAEKGLAGIPSSASTIAELLGNSAVIVQAEKGQWLWTITVDAGRGPKQMTAIRFADPVAALGYTVAKPLLQPFATNLVEKREAAKAAAVDVLKGASTLQAVIVAHPPLQDYQLPVQAPESTQAAPVENLETGSSTASPDLQAGPKKPVPLAIHQSPPPAGTPALQVQDSVRESLRPPDAEMIGWWIKTFKSRKTESVVEMPGGRVAIAVTHIEDDGLELTKVLALLERRDWLGKGEWAGRGMKVGPVQFGDALKTGFVLSKSAAESLGFFS